MIDDFLPMQQPYSPKEALQAIENGVPVMDVFARLDVDQCHFTKRVDDQGKEPVMRTELLSIGEPASGLLSLSIDGMSKQQSQMKRSVFLADPGMSRKDLHLATRANGVIFLCPKEDKHLDVYKFYCHYLCDISAYPSMLLDNPLSPQITMLEDGSGVQLRSGQILREGDPVAFDPVSGKLWAEELPLLPPDEDAQRLLEYLSEMDQSNFSQVAAHAPLRFYLEKVRYLEDKVGRRTGVGLYRTDHDFNKQYRFIGARLGKHSTIVDLSKGEVPLTVRDWDDFGFRMKGSAPVNYRLPDIHNISDLLPEDLFKALEAGDDYKQGTPLFTLRETLYRHQLETAFRESADDIESDEITITIPSVKTAEEVAHFKKMVEEVTPDELKGQIKFGVMIETKEALDNIEAIAKQCDCFCVGTNGLTESLIPECPRDVLDHSKWMKERGYEGISPYEVLVPEVSEPLADALHKARLANPNLFINMCGHQTAGHDIESINTALDMGVDQLTVPPHLENMLRTQVAIASHMANYKLYIEPNFNYGMDLF